MKTNLPQDCTIECCNPTCKKPLVLLMPPIEVINKPTVSMVCWAHPEPQFCPHCGTAHQMAFKAFEGVQIAWVPMQTRADASLIQVADANIKLPPPPGNANGGD